MPRKGTHSPRWVGGEKRTKAGYIRVYSPDHPCHVQNYVYQHRLVMEKHLGRYLDSNETVHHKYGVKDDNRIENLELWVKSQPTGQRASDLVDWAKQLLRRYEPEALITNTQGE